MSNKIYTVHYGYDDESVGYFKTEEEAMEYCYIMNKNGKHYGGYYYLEFELLNLNYIKQNIKYFFKITIDTKVECDIFTWEVKEFNAISTIANINNPISCRKNHYGFELEVYIETEDKIQTRKQIIDLMNKIQNKYYEVNNLNMAIQNVLASE